MCNDVLQKEDLIKQLEATTNKKYSYEIKDRVMLDDTKYKLRCFIKDLTLIITLVEIKNEKKAKSLEKSIRHSKKVFHLVDLITKEAPLHQP